MNPTRLIELCQKIGVRVPEWTQGAGGNLSLKSVENGETLLWIKASGSRLDAVGPERGLAVARLEPFLDDLNTLDLRSPDAELCYAKLLESHSLHSKAPGRLSMEAGFHAFLPRRWVLHFHAVAGVLMAEASQTEPVRWARWLAAHCRLDLCVVRAEMPGLELSTALANLKTADAYILASHGVILHSDDERILDRWNELEQAFCKEWKYDVVLNLLESPAPLACARARWTDANAPLKIYFPDTAVFLDQLEAVLEIREDGTRRLPPSAWEKHPNLSEIWLATLVLFASKSDLAELPHGITSKVARLPAEKLRRGDKS